MGYIYLPFDNRERCRIPRVSSAVAWRSGWLTGWKYRKPFTLSRASGAVTNYQMKLIVAESYGAIGAGVDANGCASSFNDIRFTKADGQTLLDYWIESISGTTPNQVATIWIECDSIGTGATTFYMYYGNSEATAYSNGNNTFLFFDHFDGDLSKWSGDTASASISGSICTLTNSGAGEKRIYGTAQAGNIAWRARAAISNSDFSCIGLSLSDISRYILMNHNAALTNHGDFQSSNGTTVHIHYPLYDWGNYQIFDICRNISGTPLIRGYGDGSQIGTDSTSNVPTDNFSPILRHYNAGTTKADWVLIRQYLSTEPAWGSWGAQELVV